MEERVLSPVLERTLRANVARFRHLGDPRVAIEALVKRGELARASDYLYGPTRDAPSKDARVRFLAPFDPLVWDRRRFERLWGWRYRFEAYTPKKKRVCGYYAMPMLFRDRVIGWANVEVGVGFASGTPRERAFEVALEEEIVRIRTFSGEQLVGRS